MKVLLIRGVAGTGLLVLACAASALLLVAGAWMTTVAVGELLLTMTVMVRLGFGWRIRDFGATFLVASLAIAVAEVASNGFGREALYWFIMAEVLLFADGLVGLLIAAGVQRLMKARRQGATPDAFTRVEGVQVGRHQ